MPSTSVPPAAPFEPLSRALRALAATGAVPQSSALLELGTLNIGLTLRQEVLAQVAAFSASANPDLAGQMAEHVNQHMTEICRLLAGGALDGFEFVRAHARRRAEQRFPLEALLHAYRCGHKVLAPWIRGAAVQACPSRREEMVTLTADFTMEYTNAISTVAAAEYVERIRVLAEGESDRRTQLLNMLLTGHDESDGRVARLLQRAGYLDQRQAFCVAVARSADPLEMENTARAQRIVEAISASVAPLSVRALLGLRDNLATAIFSSVRRVSGWTAPSTQLSQRLRQNLELLGPAVLIGLSSDQPSTAFIPRALHEAQVALDFAAVDRRVVQYSEISIRRLLLHRGADYVKSAVPPWMEALEDADARTGGTMIKTLHALADADLNVQQAARALRVHANTLYARLSRIEDLTGLDARRYHDLTELLLSVECRANSMPARGI